MKRWGVIAGATAGAALAFAGAATTSSVQRTPATLHRFESCDEYLDYVRGEAMPLVGPWGGFGSAGTGGVTLSPPPAAPPAPAGKTKAVSGTNLQELGVDEPDIVKADNSRLFAIADGKLFAVDLRGRRPRVAGSLDLPQAWGNQLLLHGNRLYVVTGDSPASGTAPLSSPRPYWDSGRTSVTEIDVQNPAAMRVAGRLDLSATYVAARVVRGTARLVVTSSVPHDLHFVAPTDWSQAARDAALAQNRAILASSPAANWLPTYTLQKGDRTTSGTALQCDQVWRPPTASGLGMLSILTFDLAKGLNPVDSDGVLTSGQTVYASRWSLFVATQAQAPGSPYGGGPAPPPSQVRTSLHKFDTSLPGTTTYRASGSVLGAVRDQWSLSEADDGLLRVASTTGYEQTQMQTRVTVLVEQDNELRALGHIEGLGQGEQVYAVRFLGNVGYVVTFRQTDPLYTVDLSAPSHPRLRGKLDLLGWSSYVHPLGPGLLLGLGQDADGIGSRLGTQLSLFDVRDLDRPKRLDQQRLSYASSEAEADHHAFLYWSPTQLVVVPIQHGPRGFTGAVAYRVAGGRLAEAGKLHTGRELRKVRRLVQWSNGRRVPVRRSVVVGDTLYTVSDIGVRANDVATLADEGWAGFEKTARARTATARRHSAD